MIKLLTRRLKAKQFSAKPLKTKLTVGVVLIASLLSGCATKIDEQQHQQLMKSFIADTEIATQLTGQDEINWWQQLNSVQLNQLIKDALTNNHDLKTSQLQLQSALAKLKVEKSDFLPQGGLEMGAQRTSIADNISRQSSANLALSWQLD